MVINGLVLKKESEKYLGKTGQEMTLFKFWLQAGDPVEAATEFTSKEPEFLLFSEGDKIAFNVAFRVGSRYGAPVVNGRLVSDLKVLK
jgi:hypothetical protein